MKTFAGIDIAFLPMNLPYTMTPEKVVDAGRVFNLKIIYPWHYGGVDTSKIVDFIEDMDKIGVRLVIGVPFPVGNPAMEFIIHVL